MANYLLDTNVLLRMSDSSSPMNFIAAQAATKLLEQNHQLFITSQTIIEFWVVASRPPNVNGLGWNIERTQNEVEQILNQFPQLQEIPSIFPHWLDLVTRYQLNGKRVHDARLVAVMLAHNVTHLLTFNPNDFQVIQEIMVISPQQIEQDTAF